MYVGSSFCTYIVSSDNRFYIARYTYSGADAAETFVNHIIGEVSELGSKLKRVESMKPLSPAQQQEYNHSRKCHICKKEFNPFAEELNYRKVRDPCHLTGDFRGAAHSICNLLLRNNPENVRIPFVFHNLKGYDSHLILSHIKKCHEDVDVIPNNTEKYTSFSFGEATFIDSCQFMQASLDSLAKNLEKNNFKNVRRFIESQYIIEEEEEEENQDGVVLGNTEREIIDEDNIDEEIEGRSDYRRSPYISPVLTE